MQPSMLAKILNMPELPNYFDRVHKRMIGLVSNTNPLIKEPMLRLISGLDKRFVVFLVLPVAKSLGKNIDDSVISSCAILELLNMAFCIHDDVTDNSNKRYGVPNINAVEGINQAILIGDYIINLTVQEALAVSKEIADVVINSISENRESEIIEIADRYNLDRSIASYLNCIKLKSASHLSASCQIGGLCAGIPDGQIKALAEYGSAVGMMYQLIDDLLDFVSTEQIMRKPIGKDVEEGVYTLPLLFALKSTKNNRIKELLSTKSKNSAAPCELYKILVSTGAIDKTIQEIKHQNQFAYDALKDFEPNEVLSGLSSFSTYYTDMVLESHADRLRGQ